MSEIQEIVDRLQARPNGAGWVARCPAHDDRNPSLSIAEGDNGKVLLHCHAGCTFDSIIDALGMNRLDLGDGSRGNDHEQQEPRRGRLPTSAELSAWVDAIESQRELIESRMWDIEVMRDLGVGWTGKRFSIPVHEDGKLKTVRFYLPGGSPKIKGIYGRRACYIWPECALSDERPLWLVEGEPDALAMRSAGINAATFTSGAASVPASQVPRFTGRVVTVCYDADDAGIAGAERSANAIRSVTDWVRVVSLVGHESGAVDLTDAIIAGVDPGGLLESGTWLRPPAARDEAVHDVDFADVVNGSLLGRRARFVARVIGIGSDAYYAPRELHVECSALHNNCGICPAGSGDRKVEQAVDVADTLRYIRVSDRALNAAVKDACGLFCKQFDWGEDGIALSELILTGAISATGTRVDEVTAVGSSQRHVFAFGTQFEINSCYEFTGLVLKRPWDQAATILITGAERQHDDIDGFEINSEVIECLSAFEMRS